MSSGGNAGDDGLTRLVVLCVAAITALILVGVFGIIIVGADPSRAISLVTIVLATSVTPLLALVRVGRVERTVQNVERKVNGHMSALLNAAGVPDPGDHVANEDLPDELRNPQDKP